MNEDEQNIYRANLDFNDALNTLSHYGVAGMKWGVRNADTLRKYNGGGMLRRGVSRIKRRFNVRKHAAAGRRYQRKLEKTQKKVEQKSSPTLEKIAEVKESGGYKTKEKNPKSLSDQELRSANQRLQDEITYKQRQSQLAQLNMTKGQKRVANFKRNASDVGKTVLKNFAATQLSKALNQAAGTSNAAKAAKKAKEKAEKATEKTKERIVESVYNVSYNTQINSFYQAGSAQKPKDVPSTSYTTTTSSKTGLPAGDEKEKKTSK